MTLPSTPYFFLVGASERCRVCGKRGWWLRRDHDDDDLGRVYCDNCLPVPVPDWQRSYWRVAIEHHLANPLPARHD